MVRHAKASQFEHVLRPLVAVGNDHPAGHVHPAHGHRRAQLLHAIAGTMVVSMDQGAWIVPPEQGLWIPGGVRHSFRTLGKVITRSVYIEGAAARAMPNQCRVLEISPLLRRLLIEAVDLRVEYEAGSRAAAIVNLLLLELHAARRQLLVVPFPADEALAARCRRFLESPSAHESIDAWALALAMSRRTFTRMFRRETGLSLAEWQRRAAVLQAIPRLTRGEPITSIALDLGYGSPAALTSMFKRVLGTPPRLYRALAARETNAAV